MNICIDIYSLENRGDWLMFSAILEEVRKRAPKAIVSVPYRTYALDKFYYRNLNVLPLRTVRGWKDALRAGAEKLAALAGRRRRRVYDHEIDLVLFSPGFKYSDQITYRTPESDANEIKMWKGYSKKGRKIVFMPQAFGPFENESNRIHMNRLCEVASHFYAREESSYRYLTDVAGKQNAGKISVAPDFTCLYAGENFSLPYEKSSYVVVIPNRQMIAKTSCGGAFCDFIVKSVRHLHENNIKIVFLNHEGSGDDILISVFNAYIGNAGYVVTGVSGGVCKKIISESKLVLTARFHGLVSALSSGTAVLCTSWSHKYQELVKEMGCAKSCLDVSDSEAAFDTLQDALRNPSSYSSPSAHRLALQEKVKSMWNEILPAQA